MLKKELSSETIRKNVKLTHYSPHIVVVVALANWCYYPKLPNKKSSFHYTSLLPLCCYQLVGPISMDFRQATQARLHLWQVDGNIESILQTQELNHISHTIGSNAYHSAILAALLKGPQHKIIKQIK